MTQYSTLSGLVAQLQTSAAIIDTYLQENNLPTPSFDEDGPVNFGLRSKEVQRALENAKTLSLELYDLLQGPAGILRSNSCDIGLQAIYRYYIASKVPIKGEISYQDLSEKCGLSAGLLKRLLRYTMVWNRCFREPRPGYVAHSAASRLIVDDPLVRSTMGFGLEEAWPAFAHTLDAIAAHGESQNPVHSGFSHYFKTDLSIYDYHKAHPFMAQRMSETMKNLNNNISEESQGSILAKNYPWGTVGGGSGTIVDVGGAEGHISIEIARAFPGLRFVVQDLPDTLRGVKEKLPQDVKDRIEIMEHDFFTKQPVEADVYLFSWIFHNWSEEKCMEILRNLIPKLKPGARIICFDDLLMQPGTAPLFTERSSRQRDMIMLSLFNSRERDTEDWAALFRSTDKRFGAVKTWIPEGSRKGIIETIWQV